ncbi:MAG: hypothetical protein AAF390_12755 [Pseudomonadota bacterium]
MPTTLEDLAGLVRLTSAKTNRRINAVRNETYGVLMNTQSDLTDVRQSLDLAATVAAMRDRIEAL